MDNVSKKEFVKLASESKTITELAIKLGYPKYYSGSRLSGTTYRNIRRMCVKYGVEYASLSERNAQRYDSRIKEIVPTCYSVREVIIKLGLNPDSGSRYRSIKSRIEAQGIDVSHFTGKNWNKGKTRFDDSRVNKSAQTLETSWEDAFKKGSTIHNENLIKRLICAGKMEYNCSLCGLNYWNKKPIRLRLDHIDGDNTNNEESNLRLLCSNCDSQTDSFCRGTKTKSKKETWWQKIAAKKPKAAVSQLAEDRDLESLS